MKEDVQDLMLDLLTRKAIYGLTDEEERELAELQSAAKADDDAISYELTAAAIGLSGIDKMEEMPGSLRSRIVADANRYFDEVAEKGSVPISMVVPDTSRTTGWFGWLGWAAAAAACLVLAFNVYYTRTGDDLATDRLTPAQMRQQLIDASPDLARADWGPGNVEDVAPSGDIVWSDSKQAGYLRLRGLPVNDPNQTTYQLWIFDETQDPKTPIDGGTFNVTSAGEVIIPIDAKLPAKNSKMYAITVEKPGGVVVSNREKVVALAKRET